MQQLPKRCVYLLSVLYSAPTAKMMKIILFKVSSCHTSDEIRSVFFNYFSWKIKVLQMTSTSRMGCSLSVLIFAHFHLYSFPSSHTGIFDILPTLDLNICSSLCLECQSPRYEHDSLFPFSSCLCSNVTLSERPSLKLCTKSPGHPICLCPTLFSILINVCNINYYWFVRLCLPLTWSECEPPESTICVLFITISSVPRTELRSKSFFHEWGNYPSN